MSHFNYNCLGRHFKVYWAEKDKVLEHPSETEEVLLTFYIDNSNSSSNFVIEVRDYVRKKMRVSGQKLRTDLYILPKNLKNLGDLLIQLSSSISIDQIGFSYRYGKPTSRDGRQSVPKLIKIGDFDVKQIIAPFGNELLIVENGIGVLDLEEPGQDQTKWLREGGSRQFHFGFFNFKNVRSEKIPIRNIEDSVKIYIPIKYVKVLGESFISQNHE